MIFHDVFTGADTPGKSYKVPHPASPAATGQAVSLYDVSKQARKPSTEFTMPKSAC